MLINNMLHSFVLMASSAQPGGAQQANPLFAMLPFVLMFVVFYFLLIRPQKKRQTEHQQMLTTLKKGDKVITTGGLLGTIMGVKDKTVVLKVGDGETKVEYLKSAINIINDKDIGNS